MKYRKGSMGEADAKSNKVALLVFAIVYGLILLTFCITGTYPHAWFIAAPIGWKLVGLATAATWYLYWYKSRKEFIEDTGSQTWTYIILVVIMALSVAFLAGFNFSM